MKAQEYGCQLKELDVIYVTHLHGDHIGGFPMLFLHLHYDLNRTKPLVIAGPAGTESFINKLRASTYPSAMARTMSFEIQYRTWIPNQSLEFCDRKVFAIEAIHEQEFMGRNLRVNEAQPKPPRAGARH